MKLGRTNSLSDALATIDPKGSVMQNLITNSFLEHSSADGSYEFTDRGIGAVLVSGGWPDDFIRRMAMFAWNRVRRRDTGAARVANDYARRIPGATEGEQFGFTALAHWANGGYLHLETTHKFAAALMCSKLTVEDVDDAVEILPDGAVFVRIPDGLLVGNDGAKINRGLVLFSENESGRGVHLWAWESGALETRSLAAYGEVSAWCADNNFRRESLLLRLVTGLALTVKHTTDFRVRDVDARPHGNGKERGDPPHRLYVVGRPIQVDCRPAILAYLAGDRRALPFVQTLVRGHYKRQVIGTGKADRKVIWIQPYWRGPEGAPVMVRPYRVER